MAAHGPLRIGPLKVRASAAEVEAFRRETSGGPAAKELPFTFPVRWLTHPDIRAAGASLVDGEPWVPIHESQSFDYERPLEIDTDYQMVVELSREAEPPRLLLRAEISAAVPHLRTEMVLRIVPTSVLESGG
jgi:hypothetical protein